MIKIERACNVVVCSRFNDHLTMFPLREDGAEMFLMARESPHHYFMIKVIDLTVWYPRVPQYIIMIIIS